MGNSWRLIALRKSATLGKKHRWTASDMRTVGNMRAVVTF